MTIASHYSSHTKASDTSSVVTPKTAESWHIYVTSRGEVKKINLEALMAGAGAGTAISATDSCAGKLDGENEAPARLS